MMLGQRRSWRGVAVGLGALSLALAMGACSSSGSGGAGSSGNWTIGVLMPTTGPLSALGTQVEESTQFAVDQINASGGVDGHKLKLVTYDTNLDPGTASAQYTKGVTQDHVVAFVGPLTSPEAAAVVPLAGRKQVPIVIVGASDTVFTDPAKPYVYRVSSTIRNDALAAVNYARQRGCSRPALMGDTAVTGRDFMAAAQQDTKTPFVATQPFAVDATDLSPELAQVRSANAQCILLGTLDLGAVGGMVKKMAQSGYAIPVMGDSALTLNVFTQAAGADALAKVPVYGTSIANIDSSEFLSTFAPFAKKYGGYPQGELAPAAWDAVHILAAALKATSGKGGADLQKALEGLSGSSVTALTGISADSNGFSASRHDWVPPQASRLLHNDGTKLTVAYQASGS
jgi:branched-chain amino acid transport system substrate-binding protein